MRLAACVLLVSTKPGLEVGSGHGRWPGLGPWSCYRSHDLTSQDTDRGTDAKYRSYGSKSLVKINLQNNVEIIIYFRL